MEQWPTDCWARKTLSCGARGVPPACRGLYIPPADGEGPGFWVCPVLVLFIADLQEYGKSLLLRMSSTSAQPDPASLVSCADLANPTAADTCAPRTEAAMRQVRKPLDLAGLVGLQAKAAGAAGGAHWPGRTPGTAAACSCLPAPCSCPTRLLPLRSLQVVQRGRAARLPEGRKIFKDHSWSALLLLTPTQALGAAVSVLAAWQTLGAAQGAGWKPAAAVCGAGACLLVQQLPSPPPPTAPCNPAIALQQLAALVTLPDGSPLPDAPMLDAPALADWPHSDCFRAVGPDRLHVMKKGVEVSLVGNVDNSGAPP